MLFKLYEYWAPYRIESAQGMLAERFAFCQTMPLDEFLTTAEALRNRDTGPCGSVPMPMGRSVRVAAVWTRDGRNWRISSGLTAEEVRQQDERNGRVRAVSDPAGPLTEGLPPRGIRRIRETFGPAAASVLNPRQHALAPRHGQETVPRPGSSPSMSPGTWRPTRTASPPTAMQPSGSRNPAMMTPGCTSG